MRAGLFTQNKINVQERDVDMDKKIGIIGAMELEVAALKESMVVEKVTKKAGI